MNQNKLETSIFISTKDIVSKESALGYSSKFIHTANTTIAFLDVKAGSSAGIHQDIHEQCAFVLDGQFELTVNGVIQILDIGMCAIIPPNGIHSATALTDCRLIDIFSSVREDFR